MLWPEGQWAGTSRGLGLAVHVGADGTSRAEQLEVVDLIKGGLESMVLCDMASGCCSAMLDVRHLQEAVQDVACHVTTCCKLGALKSTPHPRVVI